MPTYIDEAIYLSKLFLALLTKRYFFAYSLCASPQIPQIYSSVINVCAITVLVFFLHKICG